MAKKSALETLRRRMEGDEGDLNIDVTIVADTDADAAEEIIEVQEQTEAASEADAIVEAEEDAQQEAEDMAEMAVVLRKHGLTPGMAAVMQVTMPLAAYGITMPALESLDKTGYNQAVADRIAAALEASSDGFWSKTKKVLQSVWDRIINLWNWVSDHFRSLVGKIKRAKESLKDKTYDAERAKGKKYSAMKHFDSDKISQSCDAISTAFNKAAHGVDIKGQLGKQKNTLKITTIFDQYVENLGITLKTTDGKVTGVEKTDSEYTKLDDKDLTSEVFTELKTDAWKAEDIALTFKGVSDKSKALKLQLSNLDSWAKQDVQKDDDGNTSADANKTFKELFGEFRTDVNLLFKIQAQCNKMILKYCNAYVSACGKARLCAVQK